MIRHLDAIIRLAHETKLQSSCIKHKVGAVIFTANGNILSTGYNKVLIPNVRCDSLFSDYCIPKVSLREYMPPVVESIATIHHAFSCRYEVHAEVNAIHQFYNDFHYTEPVDLYMLITLEPCFDCAKNIVAAGFIKHVLYIDPWDKSDNFSVKRLFELNNISFQKVERNATDNIDQ